MKQCTDRIAAFVIEHLPDSLVARRACLEDLLVLLGDEHPLHGEVAKRLSLIELSEANQMELAMNFRGRARAIAPIGDVEERYLTTAREIVRLTRGEPWTKVDDFVFEVGAILQRSLQP